MGLANPILNIRKKRNMAAIVGAVVLIMVLSILQGSGVDSGPFLNRTLLFATPLILGTLGEIYSERSGILNLGLEGVMSIGAVMAVVGAFAVQDPWMGAALGMVSGALLSFVFAVMSIRFKGLQVPGGLGLFMFGLGLSGVIGSSYNRQRLTFNFAATPIPVLSDIPVLGEFLFNQATLTYLTLILAVVMWFVLYRTRPGLNIRTIGNNPAAADAAGVNVFRYRYLCVILGGALAGLAGAFISLAITPGWTEGMVGGRGWIVIALTIFSLWNPLGAVLGSLIFGGMFALQFDLQGLGFPVYILGMLPYLTTFIGLAGVYLFSKRMGAPSALLKPYERE